MEYFQDLSCVIWIIIGNTATRFDGS